MSTVTDARSLTGPGAGAQPGNEPGNESAASNVSMRERCEALQRQLLERVEAISTSEQWLSWVRFSLTMSRRQRSIQNQIWLWSQDPLATWTLGFHGWRKHGRFVRKGERGLKIWAPVTKREEDSDDGERSLAGFRLVTVFDVRQTEGRPLPEPPMPTMLLGDAPTLLWARLAGVVADAGFALERGDCGHANGWTNFTTRTIRVRDDVDAAQACKTLAHEVGHLLLDDPTLMVGASCRGHREVRAETFASMVCELAGLPTAGYSVPYVAHWATDLLTDDNDIISVLTMHTKIVVDLVDTVMAPILTPVLLTA